jgi:CheY-like chemotaxis protein
MLSVGHWIKSRSHKSPLIYCSFRDGFASSIGGITEKVQEYKCALDSTDLGEWEEPRASDIDPSIIFSSLGEMREEDSTEIFCNLAEGCLNSRPMTKPLALVFYERLMPGSQLVNRLQDIGYRVSTATDLGALAAQAQTEGPMVILMDLASDKGDVNGVIRDLRAGEGTGHIPIVGFTSKGNKSAQNGAVEAGAKLVAADDAILRQLPQLLEQVLEVD